MDKTLILNKIFEYKNFKTKTEFANFLGVSTQYLATWYTRNTYNTNKLLSVMPELNPHWLLTGEGEMLVRQEAVQVVVSDDNVMSVPVVPIHAQAGFLTGQTEPAYMNSLPRMSIIVDKQYRGQYFIFEVHGDSMNDGSLNSLLEGDMLLCRSVGKEHWKNKLHYKQWKYWVIATQDNGIVVKQIIDHDVENGIITLHSLNDYYKDYQVNLREVQWIFNVTRIVERKI